jgi:prepilin-type N-terminal cleavage/methylation domain-containing protein
MKKKYQGFTLIELLVVVAIIGLLSTLSILALNTARARARDAKRVADVKQVQTALEMYFNDVGSYPSDASITHGLPIYSANGVYLKAIPTPPTPVDGSSCPATQPDYTYDYTSATGAGGTYTINYCLGAAVNNIPGNALQTATPAGLR